MAAATLLCGLLSLQLAAQEYTSPASIAGAESIDAERLIELVSNHPGIVVIDSRLREDRAEGFIEGSINLVDRETNCDSLAGVIPGKRTPVIFYCNGASCDRSDAATRVAVKCGYTEVYWFRGGTEEWRAKKYPLVQ